jgi:NADH dehydrogenase (ubiquinone) 1 beta subcomplex subunit 7
MIRDRLRMLMLWGSQTERHSYEKCQYEEFKKRVAKMDELRAAKGGERSN